MPTEYKVLRGPYVPDAGEPYAIIVVVEHGKSVRIEWYLLLKVHLDRITLHDNNHFNVDISVNLDDPNNPQQLTPELGEDDAKSAIKRAFSDYQASVAKESKVGQQSRDVEFVEGKPTTLATLMAAGAGRVAFERIKKLTQSRQLQQDLFRILSTTPLIKVDRTSPYPDDPKPGPVE